MPSVAERGGLDRPVRVLVTGAGGPSAVGVLRSLEREGHLSTYAADIDPNAAGLYLVPAHRRVLLPRGDAEGFAEALLGWCRSAGIDVVVPTVDQELLPLARARQAFAAAGIVLVLGDAMPLERCLDKWRLYVTCADRLPMPRTALLHDDLDVQAIMHAWAAPLVVKPRRGSGSRGFRVITDVGQLADVPHDGSHLVQEHLPGAEHSIDVLASPAGLVGAVVPRARLKVDSGIAVAARTVDDPALVELGRLAVRTLGLGWVANVQVRADRDGRPRLLEVNPRFPGSMALTIAAGVDMPRVALAMALGAPMPAIGPVREVAMVRYLEERFLEPGELASVAAAPAPTPVA